jgi:hypothetical protein
MPKYEKSVVASERMFMLRIIAHVGNQDCPTEMGPRNLEIYGNRLQYLNASKRSSQFTVAPKNNQIILINLQAWTC